MPAARNAFKVVLQHALPAQHLERYWMILYGEAANVEANMWSSLAQLVRVYLVTPVARRALTTLRLAVSAAQSQKRILATG